ncbi:unnamed protein product [Peronospora destructor]|uniref:Tryptophan synthase beta chain-like PALP domain-containing protein n=1 Tax=Peronospora destructor TaxID=86335 RepID=A0AAV0V6C2_9STRA|nr:unnamed protein product [Peronospora destructor]
MYRLLPSGSVGSCTAHLCLLTRRHNNWPIVRDNILLISDDEIVSAMKLIWERMKLVVEPSGAVAMAAVLANKLSTGTNNVGIMFSGGNVNLEKLPW